MFTGSATSPVTIMAGIEHERLNDILGETQLCLGNDERVQRQRQRVSRWKRTKRTYSRYMGPAHSIELPVCEDVRGDAIMECDDEGTCSDVDKSKNNEFCDKAHEDLFDEEDAISVLRIDELEEALVRVRLEGDPEMDALMIDESEEFQTVVNTPDIPVGVGSDSGPGSLWDDLRQMANKNCLSTVQIDAILKVLNSHPECVSARLPKSYKTLLQSGRDSIKDKVRKVSGYNYFYLGLEQQLLFYLDKYPKDAVEVLDVIELVWNTDGLPLYNSRRVNCWPVLCYIANIKPRVVFEVVLTSGEGKPTGTEYLEEFVAELGQLMKHGIHYAGKHYAVTHKACVCDAPARAHVKHVKQFSSKVGCDWCEARGQHDGKRVVWVGVDAGEARTNDGFRNGAQPEHHQHMKHTPLLQLDVDMVKAFPPDFMHQSGGTMKKMLMWMLRGPRKSGNQKYVCRMSAKNVQVLDERIR